MRAPFNISLALLLAGLALAPRNAAGQSAACFDHLDRETYSSGFSSADFETSSDVSIVGGKLVLSTDERNLGDANRITINTRQKLTAHYVYESAGASHTFGWFLWNSAMDAYVSPAGWNYTTTTCATAADCDPGMSCEENGGTKYCAYPKLVLRDDGVAPGTHANNAAYDWFEALYLKTCLTCTPLLLQSPYSDASLGGSMPHIPNLLETLVTNQGGWVFLLADDDTDTSVHRNLAPVADISSTQDGIPDYDVNGDGVINALDRSVEMGTFDAGSELVFFLVVYYDRSPRRSSMGMTGNVVCPNPCNTPQSCNWCITNCSPSQWNNWCSHENRCGNCRPYLTENNDTIFSTIIPYFSKRVLNPDYTASGDDSVQRDIGCAYGSTCGGYGGWLDQGSLDRLASLYGLVMPHEVKTIQFRMGGQADHVFVGAPSTDPNWWILGFEDLYDGGDKDFNDLVFLLFRTNGGEVISKVITDELTEDQKAGSTITKVRFKKDDHIPSPPCSTDPDKVRIEYYVSIGSDHLGQPVWVRVEFPPGSDEATIDMQSVGAAGTDLRWKAVIVTDDHDCKPEIRGVDVGYEALKAGEYLFTSPLPLANALYRAGLETRSSSWTVTEGDYSSRGHFRMFELYKPDAPDTLVNLEVWNAGSMLAARNPDTRTIFTGKDGAVQQLTTTADAWVLSEILSPTDRAERLNAVPVYDLDGDGDSDDDDARWIIQWTRGWAVPTTTQRAWKLGAIHRSQGAIVHLPGEPDWMVKEGIPTTLRTSFTDWSSQPSVAERRAAAYVGSQSGMLHAFDAGAYRWGDNPDTNTIEHRGYFQFASNKPDYGDGRELWAFVPPSLLGDLKNNRIRNYYPETRPPAMVDGSVAVSDIYGVFPHSPSPGTKQWRTGIFFSLGRVRPYISALDVTLPTDPRLLWSGDWTDPDYQGTSAAPTLSFVPGGSEPTWAMATSSGLSDTPSDVYLFLVDVPTGNTTRKVKLNRGTGSSAAAAYGVAGRAVMVDQDDDGVADRIYVTDTNGRVWRHNLVGGGVDNACLVADVGQGVWHTPAFLVRQDAANQQVVTFYLGTADHPDRNDAPSPPYWVYGFVDEDQTASQCTSAALLWKQALPSDEKVWADPTIAAEEVYVGTATGDKAHLCDEDPSNPGHIYVFDLDPTGAGEANQTAPPTSAGGNVLSGLMVFDQHLLLNTVGGKTLLVGGSSWNNISGLVGATQMRDTYWNEVINK